MKVLGMISGTSHDGIDVAVVDFSTTSAALQGPVLHCASIPYSSQLRTELINSLPPAATTLQKVCELDTRVGQEFATAAQQAIDRVGPVDFICSHGQTMYHWVEDDRALGTLQIGQAAWIAEKTGAPVISDVRIRDITAGGHGAPLASLLDFLLLRSVAEKVGALNLGGISNITMLDGACAPLAYDIGPANALIHAVVAQGDLHGAGYDRDGRIAASGTVNQTLLGHLLADPYYELPPPKTTGKEHFHYQYVIEALSHTGLDLSAADLVATLTQLTVETVAREVARLELDHVIVSGGGCLNPEIMGRLHQALPGVKVSQSTQFGAPTDSKEAIVFALIGWHTAHGLPGNIASATGAPHASVLGTITPGAAPLQLPTPLAQPPASIQLQSNG